MRHDRRFVLHIGANKTGTSSIQRMLTENAPALAAAGWRYPDFHMMRMAHHRLAYSIAGHPWGLPEKWDRAFRDLVADPSQRFVFSSEVLFRMADPARVAAFFPPRETRVVLYLRDHLGYMMSWYAQAVQERNLIASFADYVEVLSAPLSGFVAAWEQAYGAENVSITLFDRASLLEGDVRCDFLRHLDGLDPAHVTLPAEMSNPSISGNLLFFKRLLNNYMTREEAVADPIPDEFGAFAAVKPTFQGRFRIGPEEVRTVNRAFHDDMRQLRERGIALPPLPEKVAGHKVPDLATLDEDIRLIKRIAQETDKRFLIYAERWQDWLSL